MRLHGLNQPSSRGCLQVLRNRIWPTNRVWFSGRFKVLWIKIEHRAKHRSPLISLREESKLRHAIFCGGDRNGTVGRAKIKPDHWTHGVDPCPRKTQPQDPTDKWRSWQFLPSLALLMFL